MTEDGDGGELVMAVTKDGGNGLEVVMQMKIVMAVTEDCGDDW